MTVERMKRPWNVVGAGFNDDGVYFTFDDTKIHRADVRLMEAAPNLLEALQNATRVLEAGKNVKFPDWIETIQKSKVAISKALGDE
jgi:hypothetical protein